MAKLSTADLMCVCLQLTGTLPTWLGTMNVTQLEVEENQVGAPCCVAHCLLLAFCARTDQQRSLAEHLRYQMVADEWQRSS